MTHFVTLILDYQIFIVMGLPLMNILVYIHMVRAEEKFLATNSLQWRKDLMKLNIVYKPILELYRPKYRWGNVIPIVTKATQALVVVWLFNYGKAQAVVMLVSSLLNVLFLVICNPYLGQSSSTVVLSIS